MIYLPFSAILNAEQLSSPTVGKLHQMELKNGFYVDLLYPQKRGLVTEFVYFFDCSIQSHNMEENEIVFFSGMLSTL